MRRSIKRKVQKKPEAKIFLLFFAQRVSPFYSCECFNQAMYLCSEMRNSWWRKTVVGQNANRTKCQPDIMPTKGWHIVRTLFCGWHFVRPNFLVGIFSWPSKHVLALCPKQIEHGVPISESMFDSFPSDRKKFDGLTLIRHTAIASRQILKRGSTSATRNSALNFKLKTPYPPLPNIFWTL